MLNKIKEYIRPDSKMIPYLAGLIIIAVGTVLVNRLYSIHAINEIVEDSIFSTVLTIVSSGVSSITAILAVLAQTSLSRKSVVLLKVKHYLAGDKEDIKLNDAEVTEAENMVKNISNSHREAGSAEKVKQEIREKEGLGRSKNLVSELIGRKYNENIISSLIFGGLTFFALFYMKIVWSIVSSWVIIVLFFFSLLCFFRQLLVDYRWKHGMYGGCEAEAREIIDYILAYQEDNQDRNGKSGRRKLVLKFNPEEMQEVIAPKYTGGEANA